MKKCIACSDFEIIAAKYFDPFRYDGEASHVFLRDSLIHFDIIKQQVI